MIAAAGKGSRFERDLAGLPKVLADVHGTPCLQRVVEAVEHGLDEHEQYVVIGHQAERVRAAIGEAPHRHFVYQAEPRGTGHALLTALETLPDEAEGALYFFCGDKPLLRGETVRRFRHRFEASSAAMLFLTGQVQGDPLDNYQGRVVRIEHDGEPHALGIVERKVIDAINEAETFRLYNGAAHRFTRDQLLAIPDVNVSTYAWSLRHLRRLAHQLSDNNPQREYLVTDLVQIFLRDGLPVQTERLSDPSEGKGIDTVQQWHELSAP